MLIPLAMAAMLRTTDIFEVYDGPAEAIYLRLSWRDHVLLL
jgi:hypothetical protein